MDERIWTDRPPAQDVPLELDNAQVRLCPPARSCAMVSGNLDAALGSAGFDCVCHGLFGDCEGQETFAVRISRQSALVVSEQRLGIDPGWHPEGFAVSDASDLHARFRIMGTNAERILAQGTSLTPAMESASASLLFHDVPALLLKHGVSFDLWIPAAHLTAMTSWLAGARFRG